MPCVYVSLSVCGEAGTYFIISRSTRCSIWSQIIIWRRSFNMRMLLFATSNGYTFIWRQILYVLIENVHKIETKYKRISNRKWKTYNHDTIEIWPMSICDLDLTLETIMHLAFAHAVNKRLLITFMMTTAQQESQKMHFCERNGGV